MPITVAGGILTALSYLAYLGGDWPWPMLAIFTVGLSGLMVCRIRFVKLSRVLVPAIRRLPEEIRWTTCYWPSRLSRSSSSRARGVVVLGAIYILFSMLDNRRPNGPAARQDQRGSRPLERVGSGQ